MKKEVPFDALVTDFALDNNNNNKKIIFFVVKLAQFNKKTYFCFRFFLLFVEPDKQSKVKESLKKLVQVDFGIDEVGSKIVLYEPAGLENR